VVHLRAWVHIVELVEGPGLVELEHVLHKNINRRMYLQVEHGDHWAPHIEACSVAESKYLSKPPWWAVELVAHVVDAEPVVELQYAS
jgi:hypothetical protein